MLHAWTLCMWGMENASWVSEHKNTALLSWESISHHILSSAWNFKFTPKNKIRSVSQLSCWFPFPQMLPMEVWRPEQRCARAAECVCPQHFHPPLPQHPREGHAPASKVPVSLWCDTGGFGDCTSLVSRLCRRAASEEQQWGKKKVQPQTKISVFKLNKVLRSTAGGFTGRKDLSAFSAPLFNARSFIINCYLLQMLKLVKGLIWNSSLDSAFLKHNAGVCVCGCVCTCKLHFIFCVCKILIAACKGGKQMQLVCSSLIYSSKRPALPVILGNEERN